MGYIPERKLREEQLGGISKMTLYRWRQDGFPAPSVINSAITGHMCRSRRIFLLGLQKRSQNKKACRTVKMATGKDEMRLDYTTSSLWQQMIEDQSDAKPAT